jgi:hypothetical protein
MKRISIRLLAFVVLLMPQISLGYQCKIEFPPFFERVDKADLIFMGTVKSIKSKTKGGSRRVATVLVKDVLKPEGKIKNGETVDVEYVQMDGTGCERDAGEKMVLRHKQSYIFYVVKKEGTFFTSRNYGSYNDSVARILKYPSIIKKYLSGESKEALAREFPKSIKP